MNTDRGPSPSTPAGPGGLNRIPGRHTLALECYEVLHVIDKDRPTSHRGYSGAMISERSTFLADVICSRGVGTTTRTCPRCNAELHVRVTEAGHWGRDRRLLLAKSIALMLPWPLLTLVGAIASMHGQEPLPFSEALSGSMMVSTLFCGAFLWMGALRLRAALTKPLASLRTSHRPSGTNEVYLGDAKGWGHRRGSHEVFAIDEKRLFDFSPRRQRGGRARR